MLKACAFVAIHAYCSWAFTSVSVKFNIVQDGSDLFASLCYHIQHHTRWQGCMGCVYVEEMLNGQYQRVDITTHVRTAHNGLLQKRLEEDLCWIVLHFPPMTQSVRDWTELNWTEQDGSVCLSVSYSTSYKMAVFASVSYFSYKMAVFASLCHTQHHTRWQCLPLCVILSIRPNGSVNHNASLYNIKYGYVCLSFSNSVMQNDSICLSVSHPPSFKTAFLASLWPALI